MTSEVKRIRGGGEKNPAYDFDTAKDRIESDIKSLVSSFEELPDSACPNGEVVAAITLHPRYLSKSDHPEAILREVGLRALGSKTVVVKPERWGIEKHPDKAPSTLLFVAGHKSSFQKWSNEIGRWEPSTAHEQLMQFESVDALTAKDRIRGLPNEGDSIISLELVLHTDSKGLVIKYLEAHAESAGEIVLDIERMRTVGGLAFMPAVASLASIPRLAQFSFLRVVRGMPNLRPLTTPTIRMGKGTEKIELPEGEAEDPETRIAVFDGGIPEGVNLPWVKEFDTRGVGAKVADLTEHGMMVTSALLFGHMHPRTELRRPFMGVDHYRVLGDDSDSPGNVYIYEVLDRIVEVLRDNDKNYEFVNISLGPQMAIEDDDVTLWTSQLDDILSIRDILVTVAVGNDGHLDAEEGLNRVQPPSDGVNVMGIGAAAYFGSEWEIAPYSCVGPGRRPGVIKPDVVGFGGSQAEPFLALGSETEVIGAWGTSFAAPAVLRSAAGIRAALGPEVSPLAIRALLVHHSDTGNFNPIQVGWGRVPNDIESMLTSDDNTFHVVYQGELPLGQLLRADIPYPIEGYGQGMVNISATLCIASAVDPDHADAYTRSGLEVFFRPHVDRYDVRDGKQSHYPSTQSFFSQGKMYPGEYMLREDGHKWESVLKASIRKQSGTIKHPCFDIYRNEREASSVPTDPDVLRYALVVSVKVARNLDLYNKVRREYQNVLQPLEPMIDIRIRP